MQSEECGIAAAFRRNQERAHLVRRQVGGLFARYLGASHSVGLVLRYGPVAHSRIEHGPQDGVRGPDRGLSQPAAFSSTVQVRMPVCSARTAAAAADEARPMT